MIIEVIGMVYFFIGLSLLIKPKTWEKYSEKFSQKASYVPWAVSCLILASFLLNHYQFNMWHDYKELVVLVIAYLCLIKACLMLFFPAWVPAVMTKMKQIPFYVHIQGLVSLAVGVWFLFL